MSREVLIWLLISLLKWVLIHSQDQSGFTSLDCGTVESYTDITTGINYVPDGSYIDSGELKFTTSFFSPPTKQFTTYRSFPNGARNCYTLPLQRNEGKQYLIRAEFYYDNSDRQNSSPNPRFDLYFGVNLWGTVTSDQTSFEMMYVQTSNVTHICLVNTGHTTPFISVLEWRLLDKVVYKSNSTSYFNLAHRFHAGYHLYDIRYKDDVYDRIWIARDEDYDTDSSIKTTENVTANIYNQPQGVLRTAMVLSNATKPLQNLFNIDWRTEHYVYLHVAEIEEPSINKSRQFDVYHNGTFVYGPITPKYLTADTHFFILPPYRGKSFSFTFKRSFVSSLPPLLNGIEIYVPFNMSQLETHLEDVGAISSVKSAYAVTGIWQGDPCAPANYSWQGIGCNFTENQPPRIISVNLSSSNLAGTISEHFYGLSLLQQLDLSNNSLHGTVPDFLGNMSSLKFLNLNGNNLTGAVPLELVRKYREGSLILIAGGNPNLCIGLCTDQGSEEHSIKKYKLSHTMSVAVHVSAAAITLLLVILIVFRKKIFKGEKRLVYGSHDLEGTSSLRLKSRNRRFSLSEILRITSNFNKVIGKGGFGTVYHGFIDGSEVAVKMLSHSSSQGFKEFKAEAQILTRVHHRNLTSLVGYCDEGDQLGLIYLFMANGNLASHITDGNPLYLTWEQRLLIALDASLGLEYLHSGCKPPIIHRDVKPTNILLDGNYQAKLADFGLSKIFGNAGGGDTDYEQTGVAGTQGYLDPEYYNSQKLSEKSDVFSYGVVLLEVITGQPVISKNRKEFHIAKWVGEVLNTQGDVKDIVDQRIVNEYDENSVWKAVELAMKCVSSTGDKRPTMSEVVIELSECLNMEKDRTAKSCEG